MTPRFAPTGQRWCCPACGRLDRGDGDRYNMGDTSCTTYAFLVDDARIEKSADGRRALAIHEDPVDE